MGESEMHREHIAQENRIREEADNQLYTDEDLAILRIDLEDIDTEWGIKRGPNEELNEDVSADEFEGMEGDRKKSQGLGRLVIFECREGMGNYGPTD